MFALSLALVFVGSGIMGYAVGYVQLLTRGD
jgi:hypothetical protein